MHRAWLLVFLLLQPHAARAGSFEVAPTTILLSASTPNNVLHITNRGRAPIFAQVEAYDWSQPGMKDSLTPSTDLLISPPMVRLIPGRQQTVRLMIRPEAITPGVERTFRLVINELPDSTVKTQGVQVLLQFIVPVFVEIDDPGKTQLECTLSRAEEGTRVTLKNNGRQRLKLSQIALTSSGTDLTVSSEAFSYILAGAARQWVIAAPLPGNASFRAQDEGRGQLGGSCAGS